MTFQVEIPAALSMYGNGKDRISGLRCKGSVRRMHFCLTFCIRASVSYSPLHVTFRLAALLHAARVVQG